MCCRDVDILYMIVKTECLAYLFHYHYSHHAKRKALLTVLQQLNIAEVVLLDFHEVSPNLSPNVLVMRDLLGGHGIWPIETVVMYMCLTLSTTNGRRFMHQMACCPLLIIVIVDAAVVYVHPGVSV